MMYKIGDIVTATCPVGTSNKKNVSGKVIHVDSMILVEFFENIGGHDGNGGTEKGKPGHCWYMFKSNLIPADSPEINDDILPWITPPGNDYSRACWYCREGGTVDRIAFMFGALVTCPGCGRVCDGRKKDGLC